VVRSAETHRFVHLPTDSVVSYSPTNATRSSAGTNLSSWCRRGHRPRSRGVWGPSGRRTPRPAAGRYGVHRHDGDVGAAGDAAQDGLHRLADAAAVGVELHEHAVVARDEVVEFGLRVERRIGRSSSSAAVTATGRGPSRVRLSQAGVDGVSAVVDSPPPRPRSLARSRLNALARTARVYSETGTVMTIWVTVRTAWLTPARATTNVPMPRTAPRPKLMPTTTAPRAGTGEARTLGESPALAHGRNEVVALRDDVDLHERQYDHHVYARHDEQDQSDGHCDAVDDATDDEVQGGRTGRLR